MLSTPTVLEGEDEYMGAALEDVSCAAADACVAVGRIGASTSTFLKKEERTLVQSFDGEEWELAGSPSPQQYSRLDAVSCGSATECAAAGSARPGFGDKDRVTLALRYE